MPPAAGFTLIAAPQEWLGVRASLARISAARLAGWAAEWLPSRVRIPASDVGEKPDRPLPIRPQKFDAGLHAVRSGCNAGGGHRAGLRCRDVPIVPGILVCSSLSMASISSVTSEK